MVFSIGSSVINGAAAGAAGRKASAYDTEASQNLSATGAQANAQDMAAYNTEASQLNPIINTGTQAEGQLSADLPALTAQYTGANLASTPGYQFTLNQGLEAAQNGFASRGLASSGAAEKGAASYATGLAQSTYNTQLQNYLSQNNQIYNMLNTAGTSGASASNALGNNTNVAAGSNALIDSSANSANALMGAGAAQAAGITGAAKAYSSTLNQDSQMVEGAETSAIGGML